MNWFLSSLPLMDGLRTECKFLHRHRASSKQALSSHLHISCYPLPSLSALLRSCQRKET